MHDSVRKIFPGFSEKLEGRVRWLYLCVARKPTVGIGCLVDTISLVLSLPWKTLSGAPATSLQITAQWEFLKKQTYLAQAGARAAEHATQLRLSDADIDALLESRLRTNEAILRAAFEGWEDYPADAQLAIHSMAWAMGAFFWRKFPNFTRAVLVHDWEAALDECTIAGEDENAGLVPRNAANRICLANAAAVRDNPTALRASETYWPLELTRAA